MLAQQSDTWASLGLPPDPLLLSHVSRGVLSREPTGLMEGPFPPRGWSFGGGVRPGGRGSAVSGKHGGLRAF